MRFIDDSVVLKRSVLHEAVKSYVWLIGERRGYFCSMEFPLRLLTPSFVEYRPRNQRIDVVWFQSSAESLFPVAVYEIETTCKRIPWWKRKTGATSRKLRLIDLLFPCDIYEIVCFYDGSNRTKAYCHGKTKDGEEIVKGSPPFRIPPYKEGEWKRYLAKMFGYAEWGISGIK
mgnify:CR=1 FL=1